MFVELKNITKYYGNFCAADNITIAIERGSLTALLGPSGSGKTTILRMIAGLEDLNSGEILIDGKRVNDASPSDRGVGFVFQNYALFRYMNVYENIAFGLRTKKLPEKDIRSKVEGLLDLTGLKGLEKRYPNELSGGQKQRVAFARAIAPQPQVLLLDEPFAAVDSKVRKELRTWLREMIHRVGITSIFVTHDHDEAVEVSDQIIVMNKGKIEQIGAPAAIYKSPDTPFVTEFVGDPIVIKEFGRLSGFTSEGFDYAIVRPEFVEAFKSDNAHFKNELSFAQKGSITDIVFKGTYYELTLQVNGVTLKSHRSPERRPIYIGEEMNIIVYRLFAIKDEIVTLMQNSNLVNYDPDGNLMEKYLYGDRYFTV